MAELAVVAHSAAALPRGCRGSGCTMAVRRCGGSRLISLAISALTRNAKGEEVKESIEAEGMMQRKRLLSLAKQFHLKKKSVSALLLHVVRCTFVHSPYSTVYNFL